MGVELAEIFRQYGPAYRQRYADRLLPSHRRAMRATPALAAQVQVLSSAAPRPWAGRYITARSAIRFSTATIRAATGIVPNANMNRPKRGWSSSRRCCCRCRTSCSPLRCRPSCAK